MTKAIFVVLLVFNFCGPKWPRQFLSTLMSNNCVNLKIFDLIISTHFHQVQSFWAKFLVSEWRYFKKPDPMFSTCVVVYFEVLKTHQKKHIKLILRQSFWFKPPQFILGRSNCMLQQNNFFPPLFLRKQHFCRLGIILRFSISFRLLSKIIIPWHLTVEKFVKKLPQLSTFGAFSVVTFLVVKLVAVI